MPASRRGKGGSELGLPGMRIPSERTVAGVAYAAPGHGQSLFLVSRARMYVAPLVAAGSSSGVSDAAISPTVPQDQNTGSIPVGSGSLSERPKKH
jgi:hypothetical protein